MTLSITCDRTVDQQVVLTLRGAVDHAGAADLRSAVSAAVDRRPPPRFIVLDLNGVEVVDDIGLGTLVVGGRICRQLGIDLVVRHPSPLLPRLIERARARRGRDNAVAGSG